jgi:hypothetical protein
VGVGIGVGVGVVSDTQYLPPLLKLLNPLLIPPQTSISLPVHTAVCPHRPTGAFPLVLVGVQLFVAGLYLPPVFNQKTVLSNPPQTIISSPVHTAVGRPRPEGALVVVVAVQLSVPGLYLPPVSKRLMSSSPPQTIISLPVHSAA